MDSNIEHHLAYLLTLKRNRILRERGIHRSYPKLRLSILRLYFQIDVNLIVNSQFIHNFYIFLIVIKNVYFLTNKVLL